MFILEYESSNDYDVDDDGKWLCGQTRKNMTQH